MATNPKDVKVDVKATIEPFPQTIEQTGRAWAAREAASVMRARALVSSGTVSPYDVIILANWISTGEQPDLEESVAIEYEGETGMAEPTPDYSDERGEVPQGPGLAGTDWPGATVVKVPRTVYNQATANLFNGFDYGGTSPTTRQRRASEFLGSLGIRVEATA